MLSRRLNFHISSQILDPNDNSLFSCATLDVGCYPMYGGVGTNVCSIAGGTMQQPCCDTVRAWIGIGCYSVDAMLVERVIAATSNVVSER